MKGQVQCYRCGAVGLLSSAMAIDFGDAVINFNSLRFHFLE